MVTRAERDSERPSCAVALARLFKKGCAHVSVALWSAGFTLARILRAPWNGQGHQDDGLNHRALVSSSTFESSRHYSAACLARMLRLLSSRAMRLPWGASSQPWRAGGGVRALSSRGGSPDEAEEREQTVRKLIAQREELTSGRHSRRHFVPIEPGDQFNQKLLEYESSARSNGAYKVAMKADTRHTKRSTRRVLENNAGKWRAFKAQLNESLATLLENRR